MHPAGGEPGEERVGVLLVPKRCSAGPMEHFRRQTLSLSLSRRQAKLCRNHTPCRDARYLVVLLSYLLTHTHNGRDALQSKTDWDAAKKILADSSFMEKLKTYDKVKQKGRSRPKSVATAAAAAAAAARRQSRASIHLASLRQLTTRKHTFLFNNPETMPPRTVANPRLRIFVVVVVVWVCVRIYCIFCPVR